jgi:hypothetical protein
VTLFGPCMIAIEADYGGPVRPATLS